jgi:hypothetical protein
MFQIYSPTKVVNKTNLTNMSKNIKKCMFSSHFCYLLSLVHLFAIFSTVLKSAFNPFDFYTLFAFNLPMDIFRFFVQFTCCHSEAFLSPCFTSYGNYLYKLFQSSSILLSFILILVIYCLAYVSFASLLHIFFLRQVYWNPAVVTFYWILKVKDPEDSPSSRETFLRWQHLKS